MRAYLFAAVLGFCAITAFGQEKPIDLATLDKDTLLVLCQQQKLKIASLEEEVANLKTKLGAQHGGGDADVDDDMTSVPEGSWVVAITSNTAVDPEPIRKQIADEQAKLSNRYVGGAMVKGIDTRLADAQAELARRSAETKIRYDKDRRITEPMYSPGQLQEFRNPVTQLEREKRGVQARINVLERQLQAAEQSRDLTGTTDDGKPVSIQAKGQAAAALAATLEVGKSYRVTGRAHFSATGGKIVLKSAVPAE